MDVFDITDLASYLNLTMPELLPSAEIITRLANSQVMDVVGEASQYSAEVQSIALEVAARAYRNPGGYASETVDDYTYRRDAATRQAGVYLTDDERSRLGLATGTGRTVHVGWLA